MREKWDPIFTFQHSGGTKREQLENNTTKGLLKTLQDTNPQVVEGFLNLFCDDAQLAPSVHSAYERVEQAPDARTLRTQPQDDPTAFRTQRGLEALSLDADRGYVLGISREATPAKDREEVKETNIPDGVIEVPLQDGLATIVLEVKSGSDRLTESELNRYAQTLNATTVEREEITWKMVYDYCLSSASDTSLSDLDRYLLAEYARYLEYEQLKATISEHSPDSGHKKSLQLKRLSGDSSVFKDGTLGIRVQWKDENSSKTSNFGWMSAEYFATLLSQVPEPVRDQTFSGDRVDYESLIKWVYKKHPALESKDQQYVFVPERDAEVLEDLPGSGRHLQFRWEKNDEGYTSTYPHLRVYRNGASCPDLKSEAFDDLFGRLEPEVREQMFCGDIDIKSGWRTWLRLEGDNQEEETS